ncbi:unnamed protein product [Bursaphelenchus okinawaensis]|uniref:Uncharacterized protein n=1 Tax=Bursaphelenchus okinawaensis TaxID=465554 RepID=A0A811JUT3_9BILA|nr:unnamed protein product [Bursaphelenchus okinawaensis]CAG9084234.1 unnamed protein product [Bursaphelenchus okinawaensis]
MDDKVKEIGHNQDLRKTLLTYHYIDYGHVVAAYRYDSELEFTNHLQNKLDELGKECERLEEQQRLQLEEQQRHELEEQQRLELEEQQRLELEEQQRLELEEQERLEYETLLPEMKEIDGFGDDEEDVLGIQEDW